MGGTVHLFNPENDLALAAGAEYYTPPAAGIAMRRAGELLPLFWAEDGDTVLVEPAAVSKAKAFAAILRPDVEVNTVCDPCMTPDPWGWSLYTRRLFMKAGMDEERLPGRDLIDRWRQLSHRRLTLDIRRMVGADEAYECFSYDEVNQAVACLDGRAVVKLPWSSSGRGVFYLDPQHNSHVISQIDGMLRRQGSVMVEPFRERIADFAALFFMRDGSAWFRALSYFNTMDGGAYAGNVIAGDDEIKALIGVDPDKMIARLAVALENSIGASYEGWLGVDMLTYCDSMGNVAIEPCVEVNLRRTMGVVAHELYLRGYHGVMRVYSGAIPEGYRDLLPPSKLGIAYRSM